MPPILDAVIGVLFVFLLFSLVVTAANEIWLSFRDKRAQFLKEGLQELLRDSGNDPNAIKADDILRHGLISALSRGKFRSEANNTAGVPSYIPGKSFVLALLSEVQKKAGVGAAASDLRGGIGKLANTELKEILLALHDDAGGDLGHLKANIENWFNESMDRVSGWYTRYAKQWLLELGLVLAVLGNVDIIHIAQVLSEPKNEAHRKALVEQATKYSDQRRQESTDTLAKSEVTPSASALAGTRTATAPTLAGTATPITTLGEAKSESPNAGTEMPEIQRFKQALAELQGPGLPIGWDAHQQRYFGEHWFTVMAGWILTALAASLGAPFWFDMLNRIVDIRSSGRAPEEKDPTATKKQSTGVESYVVSGDSLRIEGTAKTIAEQTGITRQQAPAGTALTPEPGSTIQGEASGKAKQTAPATADTKAHS